MKDGQVRCGICDINNIKDWRAHEKTLEHLRRVTEFNKKWVIAQVKDEHFDIRGFIKEIQKKAKEKKPKPKDTVGGADGFMKTISDAHALIEFYELGSVPQRDYLKACAWTLKYLEKKYGKDDYRFKHLFAHMQGDDWENSFEARCIAHAETIGCPHETIEECDEYKSEAELDFMKGKICSHCSWLESVKRKWEVKEE